MTAEEGVPEASGAEDVTRLTDAQRSLRAQMLATEHWSLLASRSTTQSEVLTRIAIFLTLVSVGLFALGVMGNATQFRGWFGVAALGVLLLLVLLGLITTVRVLNTGTEDLAHVLAMNRLRGAYLDLDPGIERYLIMSAADDDAGMRRTYFPFANRDRSQVLGSSMLLIVVVEAAITGLFVASLIIALSGWIGWAVAAGALVGLTTGALWMRRGYKAYRHALDTHQPLRRTSAAQPADRRAALPGPANAGGAAADAPVGKAAIHAPGLRRSRRTPPD
ncbi:hypothetical protein [Microbacterium sp. CFBP9034]|uniref:hypothetical protein n=1 Tax=Microbacterium sp. CFBP9034 TaxID=3096540 RepID=UPI002A6B0199|nr:hypothetical protein [Microbacterium sp. CFBP9034]MDY0910794.1 hypothetical protein [Microbacterium sp. CFBP9034]